MDKRFFISYSAYELKQIILQALSEYEKRRGMITQYGKNYSIAQAARLLGRTTSTIKKLIETGELQATSDGRRITPKAIEDYLRIRK
ncbi:MAG TPA: hypothetical protein DF409_11635 [Bacteroidales bacterium]|nr:hypothetical protein [Bacteroidales bacterium]